MWSLKAWRRRRALRRFAIPAADWEEAAADLPLLQGLGREQWQRLQELATLFLREKSLEAAGGITLDDAMLRRLALQACLPILELGLDWYEGWVSVVIHPDEFQVDHEEMDEAGVVHRIRETRAGESWERGPLVLSWTDVDAGGVRDGYNVVIHELAHKLDALNGPADGFPPLHHDMALEAWTDAFAGAYEDITRRLERGEESAIDPYAAEAPAEFFAVVTEAFFEIPDVLEAAYPAVYGQLAQFYRQQPLARLRSVPGDSLRPGERE